MDGKTNTSRVIPFLSLSLSVLTKNTGSTDWNNKNLYIYLLIRTRLLIGSPDNDDLPFIKSDGNKVSTR